MSRCPTCHRRLAEASTCARDGGVAPVASPAPPSERPELPGLRVLRVLGEGGFATVWEATRAVDPRALVPGETLAIKVSHGRDALAHAQFAREADMLRRAGAPHVPRVYETGILPDQRAYLAMDRLVGMILSEYLESPGAPRPAADALPVLDAVLATVQALHERQVIHCDLKPDNVFLVGAPVTARLVDLGLARQARPGAGVAADARMGTPEYMSPEQIRGVAELDARSDVYSLGVIAYELLTLRPPFVGDRAAIEQAHLSQRPPPMSSWAEVPLAVEQVVLKCLAKEPDRRHASIAALREALRHAADEAIAPRRPAVAAPAPAPAATGPDRPRVALLFCRIAPDRIAAARAMIEGAGGLLAHTAGELLVGAFTSDSGDRPLRKAVAVAQGLTQRRICERVVVDVSIVRVIARPGSPTRFLSPLFARAESYSTRDDPPGILLTQVAREVLGTDAASEPISGRPGRFLVQSGDRARPELTVFTVFERMEAPLVGRSACLAALVDHARVALTTGVPAVATLIGEPGMGKSHVGAALIEALRSQLPQAQILSLRATEPIAGDADKLLRELLLRAFDAEAVADAAQGRALVEAQLGDKLGRELFSALAFVLGWVAPDDPGVASLRASPGVLRAAIAKALGEVLRRRAQRQPLCVLVDDAQWADPTTLDGLEYATANDATGPLWVAVLARPSFERTRAGWGTRAATHHVEQLGPLERDVAAVLCRQLLSPAEHIPDSAIDLLVERSRATPLLLIALVTGLKRDGLVRALPGGGAVLVTELLDRLPDLPVVEWLAMRDLEALPPELASFARLLSLLAPELSADEFEGIVARLDDEPGAPALVTDPRVGLAQLRAAGLLVQHRDGRLGFRHSLARDAIAAAIPEPLRLRIHRAALTYYQGMAETSSAIRLPRIAHHAARVGDRAVAAAAYLEVAALARNRHAYLEAEVLYSRGLDNLDPAGPARAAGDDPDDNARTRDASNEAALLTAHRGRGIMRYRIARYDDSITDLRTARDLASRRGDPQVVANILLDAAMALDWIEEWRESRELCEAAARLIAPSDPPLLHARLLQAQGRAASRFNQDHEAIACYEQAIRAAEALGDDAYEVLVTSLMHLGFMLPFVGRLDEGQACLERALALGHARSDEFHVGGMYNNRGCLWIALNDRARALADLELARGYARRLGIGNLERNVEINLGTYLYWIGEIDQAEPHVRRMIELGQRRTQHQVRPDGDVLLARLLFARGDVDRAREIVERVTQHQIEMQAQGLSGALLMPNDRVLFDVAALCVHGGSQPAWDEVCARAREVSQGQELIEVMELRGLAAARHDDRASARRAWLDGVEIAGRIPNVFLERLRAHLARLPPAA